MERNNSKETFVKISETMHMLYLGSKLGTKFCPSDQRLEVQVNYINCELFLINFLEGPKLHKLQPIFWTKRIFQ